MNTIKIIFRNLKKKGILTTLRFVSILLGVGVALYIFELNSYQFSYDKFWKDADKIYRIALIHEENGEVVTHSARNFSGAPSLLKNEIPGIESACGFGKDKITIFCNEEQFSDVNWLWADTSIFSVFHLPIVLSESNDIWTDIHGVTISESYAKKLYGDQNPINKKFKLNEGWEFYVKAVFKDVPENSHLGIDFIASRASISYYMRNFDNNTGKLIDNNEFTFTEINPYNQRSWGTPYTYRKYCYIRLSEGTDINQVELALPSAIQKINLPNRYSNSTLKFNLQPINEIHLRSNLEQEFKANGSIKRVQFLYLIAVVILLVSFINFLNLTNIQTIENGKNFAIQILNGARLPAIFRIIFIENLILTCAAALTATTLLFIFKSDLLPVNKFSMFNLVVIGLVLLGISLASAIVPYFRSLHGKFKTYLKTRTGSLPGTWSGRRLTVIIQFCIAILLISGTILIGKQMRYMSDYRLGFEPQQTMFSYSPMSMNLSPEIIPRLKAFKNEVLKVPGVVDFSVSSSVPGRNINRVSDDVKLGNSADVVPKSFSRMSASEAYTNLFDIKLIAGRNFRSKTNWSSDEVLINKTAMNELGFQSAEEATNHFINYGNSPKKIVGVIDDYNHLSLKSKIQPLIIEQNLNWDQAVGYYCLKFNASRTEEILKTVSEIWERIYPVEVANFQFTDNVFAAQYVEEKKFQNITSFGSLLALLISCIGLFAIAAFDTQKRIKEIGVRKVNGAKVSEILSMLNKDFVKWVVLAFIIACPLAWFTMNSWLENFAYKTTLSWWIFALAGVLALGIALFTVSFQSYKAATRNPIESLRYE